MLLWKGSVSVPADFLGLSVHGSPNGYPTSTARPTFPFSVQRIWDLRTSDNKYCTWAQQSPAAGITDFTQLREAVRVLEEEGRQGWYTMMSTPTRYAAAGLVGTPDPYGYLGGTSAPTNMLAYRGHVTAVMREFNANGRKFFKYIEPWNEPEFPSSNFYVGTATQMAQMMRHCYQAAKAIDPDIIVTSPSDWSSGVNLVTMAAASDGAGGTGADWIDAVCLHPYFRYWHRDPHRESEYGYKLGNYMQAVRANLATAGLSDKPIVFGECGYSAAFADAGLAAATIPQLADWIRRIGIGCAIEGVKELVYYGWDTALLKMPIDEPILQEAFAGVSAAIPGKTIYEVHVDDNNGYDLLTNEGWKRV